MPVSKRTLFVASGLLIAALTVCLVPQSALTQDQTPRRPTTPPPSTQPGNPTPVGKAYVYQEQPDHGLRMVEVDDTLPNEHKFDETTRELLSTYSKTSDSDRPAFVEKLTAVVTEHFDFKQTSRERELAQLEEQVKKLRALHDQRAKEKNDIIQDRVRQLVRDAAGMGWGSTNAGGIEFVARTVRSVPQQPSLKILPNGVVVSDQPAKPGSTEGKSSVPDKK